jgi:hypothetical protein
MEEEGKSEGGKMGVQSARRWEEAAAEDGMVKEIIMAATMMGRRRSGHQQAQPNRLAHGDPAAREGEDSSYG